MTISDETLNAFVDGQLPDLEMRIVRDAIANDENVAQRVENLMLINSQVQASLSRIDAKPLNPGLEKLCQKLQQQNTQKASNKVVPLKAWRRPRIKALLPSALAASIAAVFGFYISFANQASIQALPDWQAVSQVLASQPSGQTIITGNGSQVEVIFSFKNQGGHYCRQFYWQNTAKQTLNSLACHDNGQWQIQAVMPVASNSGFQTASSNNSVNRLVDSIIQGDVITGEQEAEIIQRNWQH